MVLEVHALVHYSNQKDFTQSFPITYIEVHYSFHHYLLLLEKIELYA